MTYIARRILAQLSEGAPPVSTQPTIRLVDVAAQARELLGDAADDIARAGGRRGALPTHDWRFELDLPNAATATMHAGATARDVAAYLALGSAA